MFDRVLIRRQPLIEFALLVPLVFASAVGGAAIGTILVANPLPGVERALVIEKVRAVLAEMNPEQSKLLELAFFQGLTHTEIAEKTGEPLGTIKTRIRSGLQLLRAKFAG